MGVGVRLGYIEHVYRLHHISSPVVTGIIYIRLSLHRGLIGFVSTLFEGMRSAAFTIEYLSQRAHCSSGAQLEPNHVKARKCWI